LDIPEVNLVVFYEPIPSAIRRIQRAGRTARLMKGKLIILMTKDTLDEIFHYASRAKEKRMYNSIESIKRDLDNGISIYSNSREDTSESSHFSNKNNKEMETRDKKPLGVSDSILTNKIKQQNEIAKVDKEDKTEKQDTLF